MVKRKERESVKVLSLRDIFNLLVDTRAIFFDSGGSLDFSFAKGSRQWDKVESELEVMGFKTRRFTFDAYRSPEVKFENISGSETEGYFAKWLGEKMHSPKFRLKLHAREGEVTLFLCIIESRKNTFVVLERKDDTSESACCYLLFPREKYSVEIREGEAEEILAELEALEIL